MKDKLEAFRQKLNSQTSGDMAKQCIDDFHRRLLKCPKCKSPNITHTVDFNGETGMAKVTLACNECGYDERLQGDDEMEGDRRFVLSDLYNGNDTAPIRDNLLHPEYDEMFYTEIVARMNDLHNENKELWEENKKLRQSNKVLRANRKDCEKGRAYEHRQRKKFDEFRLEQLREMHQYVKDEYLKRVTLEKENEWLKQSNKNLERMLYPTQRWERTDDE